MKHVRTAVWAIGAVMMLGGAGAMPAMGAGRGDLPPAVIPQGVGVNIHFRTGHTKDLDMIAAAGIHVVRMDFAWEAVEHHKGAYDFSAYDELTKNLKSRGIQPWYILDYSNRLYAPVVESMVVKDRHGPASPADAATVAAFAKFAAAAAAHFKGQGVIWEIWNEPNIGFWFPKPSAKDYATLAVATVKAVRGADAKATIVAPGSSGFAWRFYDTVFATGILADLNGVSVHPYRGIGPDTVGDEYARLREVIAKATPSGSERPVILSGEWGYSTNIGGGQAVSQQVQAEYAVRQQLVNLMNGVPISIWYDWINDGPDPHEREHHFGLVARDHTPKPSYNAIKMMTHALDGCQFVGRLRIGDKRDFALIFADASGHRTLAAWTSGEAHVVDIALDQPPKGKLQTVELIDGTKRDPVEVHDAKVHMQLNGAVCCVRLD